MHRDFRSDTLDQFIDEFTLGDPIKFVAFWGIYVGHLDKRGVYQFIPAYIPPNFYDWVQ